MKECIRLSHLHEEQCLDWALDVFCKRTSKIDRHHIDEIIKYTNLQKLCESQEKFLLHLDSLKSLVYLQLTSASYNLDMLEKYFYQVSIMTKVDAEFGMEMIQYFILYVHIIPTNREIREEEAIKYISSFISWYLNTEQDLEETYRSFIKLCIFASNLFPSLSKDLIPMLKSKADKLDFPAKSLSRFDLKIALISEEILRAINVPHSSYIPDYFLNTIDYLIEYLESQDSYSESYQKLLRIYDHINTDYVHISYEKSQKPKIAAKELLSVLRRETTKLNSSEEEDLRFQDNESIEYQIKLLSEFKRSILCKMMFDSSVDFQVRQFLVSHFKTLFSLNLKKSIKTMNFMSECYMITLEMVFNPIVSLSKKQKKVLRKLIVKKSVVEVFQRLELYGLNQALNSINSTFFAHLPHKYSAITVFGGSILINSRFKIKSKFNECALKIIFLHELANYMKQFVTEIYSIYEKAPKYTERDIFKGLPGCKSNKKLENKDREEGGWFLENKMLNCYFSSITEDQISFLNNLNSWNTPLDMFKREIESEYSEDSFKYDLGESNKGYYHFERLGHNRW